MMRKLGVCWSWGWFFGVGMVAVILSCIVWQLQWSRVLIDLDSSDPVYLGVSVRDAEGQTRRTLVETHPALRQYEVGSRGLRERGSVAISVSGKAGTVVSLQRLVLESSTWRKESLSAAQLATEIDIEGGAAKVERGEQGLELVLGNKKTLLRWRHDHVEKEKRPRAERIRSALITASPFVVLWTAALGLISVAGSNWQTLGKPRFAVAACGIASILAAAMSVSSGFNSHPDEIWHFSAAGYYRTQTLPPAADDPLIQKSYSAFGHSYANELEIYYPLAGKWLATVERLFGHHLTLTVGLRLFQTTLFAGLCLWLLARGSKGVMLMLLVTSQLWYLFSYPNSDGLAFVLATLLVFESASRSGVVAKLAASDKLRVLLIRGCWVGLLVGAVFWSKKTFWIVLPFVGALIFVEGMKKTWSRRVVGGFVGGCLLGCVGLHLAMGALSMARPENASVDVERSSVAVTESQAERLSEITSLRAQGLTPWQVIFERGWAWHSVSSFFGVFGWLNARSPDWLYLLQGALFIGLVTLIGVGSWRQSKGCEILLPFAAVVSALGCLFLSFYWSWNISFQPQGRYLFALLLFAGALWERLPSRWWGESFSLVLVVGLFLSALASFLFTGLQFIDDVHAGDYL